MKNKPFLRTLFTLSLAVLGASASAVAQEHSPNAATSFLEYPLMGDCEYRPSHSHTLWYRQPATLHKGNNAWMEYALPLGNGQLGACILGGVYKDEIQFNEKTLWTGGKEDDGARTPDNSYGAYQNFGSVFAETLPEDGFGFDDCHAVKDYVRGLDLSTATAFVRYKSTDRQTTYRNEYIVSYPDRSIVAHYTAEGKGKINRRFTLVSGKPGVDATTSYKEGEAFFSGKLQTVTYAARLKVVADGGMVTTDGQGITVKGANSVKLVLVGATDFDPYTLSYTSHSNELTGRVRKQVEQVAAKKWRKIYKKHVADFQQYYHRVSFELAGAANEMPTDALILKYGDKKLTQGNEAYALWLEQIYFHYGRYLEICSSRGVDLPSNLQGIWNNSSTPPWNGDIHANINVQMNYWPAEVTNLSEMHLPFLNYLYNMAVNQPQWKKYAQASGQSKGWTCYTENNIFGGVGRFAQNNVIINAWYCSHLWQHYRFTQDRKFLQEKALPVMWSACEYWLERLVKDKDGKWVCPNEYSPEQGPVEDGVAHGQQLIYDLFASTVNAFEVLGAQCPVGTSDQNRLRSYLQNLDDGLHVEEYTGKWGNPFNGVQTGDSLLREWKYSTYAVGEKEHRHMSHFMCFYPMNQVSKNSPYFTPVVNSLKLRGDANYGWGMGWRINLWARALDATHAHKILTLALNHHSLGFGGVYFNLFDCCPPFQIDGNFGACAGIAEMCLQSHTDTIQLLPALPAEWNSGEMNGLRSVGAFEVSQKWNNGLLKQAIVKSDAGQPCHLNYPKIAGCKVVNSKGREIFYTVLQPDLISFETKRGETYTLLMDEKSSKYTENR